MTCVDCGYMMGDLDKSCLRCAAKDKSNKNPYVAFQNEQHPPADQYAVAAPEVHKRSAPHVSASDAAAPVQALSFPNSRSRSFWPMLLTALLVLFIYHVTVVSGMQSRLNDQQRQIVDQQKQIDDLRDIVNYNANAANMGRF